MNMSYSCSLGMKLWFPTFMAGGGIEATMARADLATSEIRLQAESDLQSSTCTVPRGKKRLRMPGKRAGGAKKDTSGQPGPASRLYEEEAAKWESSGELQWAGKNEYALVKLLCWLNSTGAKKNGVSERLMRYAAAAKARFDGLGYDWYGDLLRQRDYCSGCGETFRVENLSLCTHCDAMLGYCCSNGKRLPNGNQLCPRCDEGEIVG
jgi:hypothetical protein